MTPQFVVKDRNLVEIAVMNELIQKSGMILNILHFFRVDSQICIIFL